MQKVLFLYTEQDSLRADELLELRMFYDGEQYHNCFKNG